jgi:hypothetical protein
MSDSNTDTREYELLKKQQQQQQQQKSPPPAGRSPSVGGRSAPIVEEQPTYR